MEKENNFIQNAINCKILEQFAFYHDTTLTKLNFLRNNLNIKLSNCYIIKLPSVSSVNRRNNIDQSAENLSKNNSPLLSSLKENANIGLLEANYDYVNNGSNRTFSCNNSNLKNVLWEREL